MRFGIELGIEVGKVPAALEEIRREGAQRRAVYPKWIEAGKLAPATAQRRMLALADAYRIIEAVAFALAPLIAAEEEKRKQESDLFRAEAAKSAEGAGAS